MFVTVIICSRNRADGLRRTLESLSQPENLKASDWEVLVVDNGSDDLTPDVCRDFHRRFPKHFRSIVETKVGKSNALNAGIAAARGDVLAFTDDDVICAPDFLPGIREFFAEIPADGVQGRVFLDCEGGQPEWLDSHLALTAGFRDCGEKVVDLQGTLFGLNMVIRAEVFQKIGGFSSCLGPGQLGLAEDTELSLRMRRAGMRLMYAPQIVAYHRLPRRRLTRGFLRQRFFQEGRATAYGAALPVSFFRFGLYVAKEFLSREIRAIQHRRGGRPALALRQECEAFRQAGFFWQHVCFKRGVPSRLSLGVLPSRGPAIPSHRN